MGNIKKSGVLGMIALLIIILASVGGIAQSFSIVRPSIGLSMHSDIAVSLLNQEPDPAEPGGIVEVRFMVENRGGDPARDLVFEILPEYPFSLVAGEDSEKIVGTLESRQTSDGDEEAIVHYKLKIDEDAVEGEHKFDVRFRKDGSNAWTTINDFVLRVRTHDAIIDVTDVTSEPRMISPGDEAKIIFKVKNIADSLIKDIKIKLDLSEEDTPFAPVGAVTEKRLAQLESKEVSELKLDVTVLPDAQSKTYKVPITLHYSDSLGTEYEQSDLIGVLVGDNPELVLYIRDKDLIETDTKGKFTIEMANSGLIDVKFMRIHVNPSKHYELLSNNLIYIGDIDSDDTESEEFEIFLKSSRKGIVDVPVTLEYRDANNNEYKEDLTLQFKVYSKDELKSMSLGKSSSAGIIIVVVIVGVGLLIYWRIRKKRKK